MSKHADEMVAPTDAESRSPEPTVGGEDPSESGQSDRAPEEAANAPASPLDLADRNIAVAVTIRAVERNRRVAATVLAGGFAYRIFLWLLPFGLLVGGALGLSNANSTEDAVSRGGLPGAVTNAVGDAARSAQSDSWWLFAVGVPLLLWAGFSAGRRRCSFIRSSGRPASGAQATQDLARLRGRIFAFMPHFLTWWLRDNWPGFFARPCSPSRRSGRSGSGYRFNFRTGTLPGRHSSPERSGCDRISGASRAGRPPPGAEAREVDLAARQPRRHDDAALLHVHARDPRRLGGRSQQLALRRAHTEAPTSIPNGSRYDELSLTRRQRDL